MAIAKKGHLLSDVAGRHLKAIEVSGGGFHFDWPHNHSFGPFPQASKPPERICSGLPKGLNSVWLTRSTNRFIVASDLHSHHQA